MTSIRINGNSLGGKRPCFLNRYTKIPSFPRIVPVQYFWSNVSFTFCRALLYYAQKWFPSTQIVFPPSPNRKRLIRDNESVLITQADRTWPDLAPSRILVPFYSNHSFSVLLVLLLKKSGFDHKEKQQKILSLKKIWYACVIKLFWDLPFWVI